MPKKISVTGWVPKDEDEMHTLRDNCYLDPNDLKEQIKGGIFAKKAEAIASGEADEYKRIRVTVVVDVEKL